jgi:hypothetical protein
MEVTVFFLLPFYFLQVKKMGARQSATESSLAKTHTYVLMIEQGNLTAIVYDNDGAVGYISASSETVRKKSRHTETLRAVPGLSMEHLLATAKEAQELRVVIDSVLEKSRGGLDNQGIPPRVRRPGREWVEMTIYLLRRKGLLKSNGHQGQLAIVEIEVGVLEDMTNAITTSF